MAMRTFAAVIHKGEEQYVADCPQVGTVSQGHTIEEALANLKEATELYLGEFPAPPVTGQVFITLFEAAVAPIPE